MTEKDFKKLQHFIRNKREEDAEEVVSFIQKKEKKEALTEEQWKELLGIACSEMKVSLQKWILENRIQLGKEAVKYGSIIADFAINRYDKNKVLVKMFAQLQKNTPTDLEQELLGTAYVVACKNNNILLVKYLLEQGVDVNYKYKKKTGIEAAVEYSESKMGNGDETLYRYLLRNQEAKGELEDIEKYYVESTYGRIYTPDADSLQETENELLAKAGIKRAEFLCGEYGNPGLLKETTTSDALDAFMENYNWDDGLEIPYYVAMHANCSLATALRIFWEGEGISMFLEDYEDSDNKEWKYLLETVYNKILNGDYKQEELHYTIPLNKVWISKLKKQGVPDILLNDL